ASGIHSQFGSIDPVFYSAWDYDNQRPKTGVEVVSREVPREYRLGNYPNPFNPETEVRYEVARAGHVRVEVYNLLGVRVARLVDEEQVPGVYRVRWDGRDELGRQVVSGVYVCRLVAGEVVKTAKMVLVR
ncbi:MAG: T9SS type A sorting domain-containing protein, partial [Calditrichaeota bacterium]|nr:T9SS type A sorting domain-containing protein [Calditrichota bacterium]MBC7187805.1 T9SS type A sorting domain-containing protein [Calditrichota bacterium]